MIMASIEAEMNQVDEYLNKRLLCFSEYPQISNMLESIRAKKGKRLRPQLLLLSAHFTEHNQECSERLFKLAAMIETIHIASLVHDDVVDDSPLRRGIPTTQALYGKKAAVFAGDLLIGRLSETIFDENFRDAGVLLAKTVQEMCCGEISQLGCVFNRDITMDDYMRYIFGKTAALFRTACLLGALESGADDKTAEALGRTGEYLGMAFQLRDDLLDFIGDEQKEGKPRYMDLRDGIYTPPMLFALAASATKARMREIAAADNAVNEERLPEIISLIEQADGIFKTMALLRDYLARARGELEMLRECDGRRGIYEIIDIISLKDRQINSTNQLEKAE
ncbi:MAG: polyprenyl synthetase family protein [Oscillospiraceae bacterium]